MIIRELYTETLDRSVSNVHQISDDTDTKTWQFEIGENTYHIMMGLIPHDDEFPSAQSDEWWGVAFAMIDSNQHQPTFDMTGTGNAHAVLATVVKTWFDFAKQYPTANFYFSSDNNNRSRTKVYTRIAKRFTTAGYQVETEQLGSDTEFYIYKPSVNEARRNPEKNPRVSINSAIKRRLASTNDQLGGMTNMFISFSPIEKIGIYPQSEDRTPIGIYSYPAEYAVDIMGEYFDPAQVIPYAGNRPWVNIFQMKGNFLSLKMTGAVERKLYRLLVSIVEDTVPSEHVDFVLSELDDHIEDALVDARQPEQPGGRFWYVTHLLSKTLSDSRLKASKWNNRFPVNWNLLFRVMGIDGLVDPGLSIIHDNEPTQAVAFSGRAIKNNERIANKYSPQRLEHQKTIRELNSGSIDEQFEILKNKPSWIKHIINPDTELLLKLLDYSSNHAFNIAILHSDDVQIQTALVDSNPRSIQWIRNPDESVQKQAVKARPEYIQYISKPTKSVQLLAVKSQPYVFNRIENPDPAVVAYHNQISNWSLQ